MLSLSGHGRSTAPTAAHPRSRTSARRMTQGAAAYRAIDGFYRHPGKPSSNATQPSANATQPTAGTTQPSANATQPSANATQPTAGTTRPSDSRYADVLV